MSLTGEGIYDEGIYEGAVYGLDQPLGCGRYVIEMIEATRRHLLTGLIEPRNRLRFAVGPTDTTLSFSYELGNIRPHTRLSLGLEDVYVWEVNESAATAKVDRGQFCTLPRDHVADTLVRVSPRFSDAEIVTALNQDLYDLSSPVNGLFQIKTLDRTVTAGLEAIDLAGDLIDIYEVSYALSTPSLGWQRIDYYDLVRNMSTTTFASGMGLVFREAIPSGILRIRYKAMFNPITDVDFDVAVATGLPPSAVDLPPLGAALSLMAGRPVRRGFSEAQGDPRRATEVSVGDVLNSPAQLQRHRQARIRAESSRLGVLYPAVVSR